MLSGEALVIAFGDVLGHTDGIADGVALGDTPKVWHFGESIRVTDVQALGDLLGVSYGEELGDALVVADGEALSHPDGIADGVVL